jgi:hypothetical protein
LEAPAGKSLVWFEESAHFPVVEEPGKFNQQMVRVLQETYPQASKTLSSATQ